MDAGCRADPPLPKVIRALGPRAQAPPDVVLSDLDRGAAAGQLVRHAVERSVARLVGHDPGVRLGDDPEDVHQYRVATRRLRSDLRTFGALLQPEWVDRLRAELAWLGGVVGTVRDLDVLSLRLRTHTETLPDQDAPAAAVLLGRLTDQQRDARAVMLDAMRSSRYDALLDGLVAAANRPAFAGDAKLDQPAQDLVAEFVRRPRRHLVRAVDALGEDPSDEELHAVRIAAKRCRYAAEAAVPVVGHPATRFAAAIADVQTVLRDHQDCHRHRDMAAGGGRRRCGQWHRRRSAHRRPTSRAGPTAGDVAPDLETRVSKEAAHLVLNAPSGGPVATPDEIARAGGGGGEKEPASGDATGRQQRRAGQSGGGTGPTISVQPPAGRADCRRDGPPQWRGPIGAGSLAAARSDIAAIAVWAVPAGIIGARLYHLITDYELYTHHPWRALASCDGGLGIPGGIAAGVAAGLVVARPRHLPIPALLDTVAPTLALAQAIGRWELVQPGAVRTTLDPAVGRTHRPRQPACRPRAVRHLPDVPVRVAL